MEVNNIVIVGGGSAGWMTASFLIKMFPEKNISVIESPDIPRIGVGESTYDGIQHFVQYLDVDYRDFFAYTDASIKLAIEFGVLQIGNLKKHCIQKLPPKSLLNHIFHLLV